MLLPTPITRSRLRGFWLVISLALGAVAGAIVALSDVSLWGGAWAVFLAATVVIAVPGLVRPYSLQLLYRGWNWAVRRLSRYLVRYVTTATFHTVVLALAFKHRPPKFERSPSESSMWRSRGTQVPEAYVSQYADVDAGGASNSHWTGPMRAWLRSSGHGGARILLPFVVLARLVSTDQVDREPKPSHIYTLY